jgi:dolichol-phosphate mannosyltransferase
VVPTYNERENVVPLVRELVAQGEAIDAWVADDNSPDGTADAVRALVAECPGRVELLLRPGKAGRGAAAIAAFKKGLAEPRRYETFLEMDADFSHHPREASKLTAEEIYTALVNFALLRFRYGFRPRRRSQASG